MKAKIENNSDALNGQAKVDLDALINRLKEMDERQKITYKRFSILLFILVPLYLLLFVVNPDPELDFSLRIAGLFYVLAFLAGAFLFRNERRKMMRLNYADPLLKVMEDAVKRYSMFRKSFWQFLLVPLLINIGYSIHLPGYIPGGWSHSTRFLVMQIVYWGIIVLAGFIGYLIWRKRSKPYRDAVQHMIDELGS